jgi:hypothetical protein
MRIIATPIILENYKNWVIMEKSAFLNCFRDNHWEISKDNPFDVKKIIEKNVENWTIMWDFWNLIIVDRRFYDNSKLKDYYI